MEVLPTIARLTGRASATASRDGSPESFSNRAAWKANGLINQVRSMDSQIAFLAIDDPTSYYGHLLAFRAQSLKQLVNNSPSVNWEIQARLLRIHNDLLGQKEEAAPARAVGDTLEFLTELMTVSYRARFDKDLPGEKPLELKFGATDFSPSINSEGVLTNLYMTLLLFRDRFEYRQYIEHVVGAKYLEGELNPSRFIEVQLFGSERIFDKPLLRGTGFLLGTKRQKPKPKNDEIEYVEAAPPFTGSLLPPDEIEQD